jgi:ribonucleotide reductase alpha subunit
VQPAIQPSSFHCRQKEGEGKDGKPGEKRPGEKLPEDGAEHDARQVFHRPAFTWIDWGRKNGYFDGEADERAFYDETCYMLARQIAAPNSPQWFNTGLYAVYGIDGPAQGHYYFDPALGKLVKSGSAYQRPQPHACFILPVEDDLVNDGGIMDLVTREARLFKYGSGTGSNFSHIRAAEEKLSGGGVSSGLLSFLKIGDRSASANATTAAWGRYSSICTRKGPPSAASSTVSPSPFPWGSSTGCPWRNTWTPLFSAA